MNKLAKAFLAVSELLLFTSLTCLPAHAAFAASAAKSPPDLNDRCYAPTLPLTLSLRKTFIEDVKPLAIQAEKDHGVPAAILAAMSIKESGYGTTKLALAAHNVLSYKWNSKSGPGGRSLYTLTCQPASDSGNTYVVFKDRADSADFVAGMFESSKYYKDATRTYRGAVANGQNSKEAAITWLRSIAPSYNPYQTAKYVSDVLKIADDPINQSGKLVEGETFWEWTSSTTTIPVAASDAATGQDSPTRSEIAAVVHAKAAAYAVSGATNQCPQVDSNKLGWESMTIRECVYKGGDKMSSLTGYVLLLDVEPDTIAKWIKNACSQELPDAKSCFSTVLNCGKENSGMMFPISGNLMENMGNGPWKNYFFRNGMTVRMALQENGDSAQIPLDRQKELAMMADSQVTAIPSGLTRYWRTTPAQFAAHFPDASAPTDVTNASDRQKWLDVVRSEILSAMNTLNNRLLDAWIAAHRQTLSNGKCPSDTDP